MPFKKLRNLIIITLILPTLTYFHPKNLLYIYIRPPSFICIIRPTFHPLHLFQFKLFLIFKRYFKITIFIFRIILLSFSLFNTFNRSLKFFLTQFSLNSFNSLFSKILSCKHHILNRFFIKCFLPQKTHFKLLKKCRINPNSSLRK